MNQHALAVAFAHSSWATARLIEACEPLSAEQLEAPAPGTYGSIISALRHLVEDEAFYVFVLYDESPAPVDASGMNLRELFQVNEATGAAWAEYFALDPNPESWRREVDDGDGFTRDATVAIRLVQQLHHSGEHRTQVCTGLSLLGLEPPKTDAFAYGLEAESVREWMPDTNPA